EVEVPRLPGGLQNLVCIPAELVALAVLAADVEKSHPGILDPQDPGGVEAAQVGELDQVLHGALRVGAAVDEHRPAPGGGDGGGHGGTADAPDPLDQQGAGGEKGPSAAGGDKGIPLPRLQQVQAHGDGGVLFHLKGGGGVVVHVDDLRGVDHGHPRRQAAALLRRGADLSLPAQQNKLQAGPGLGGVDDPADDLQGGVVAAHGGNDNFHAFSPYFWFFHRRCRWKNMSDPTVRNELYFATVYLAAPPGVNTQS